MGYNEVCKNMAGYKTKRVGCRGDYPRPLSSGRRAGIIATFSVSNHFSESLLMMFMRAFLRLFLLGDLTAGLRPPASSWSLFSSISMVMTTFFSPTFFWVPSLPANRYFLDLLSLADLVRRLWSSMAYRTGCYRSRGKKRGKGKQGGKRESCHHAGSQKMWACLSRPASFSAEARWL